jgi:UDP-N-acetylmuramyl tripeptide synthase
LAHAIDRLNPGDALLVAGKGHEKTQTIGHHILEHSDQAWIKAYTTIQNAGYEWIKK